MWNHGRKGRKVYCITRRGVHMHEINKTKLFQQQKKHLEKQIFRSELVETKNRAKRRVNVGFARWPETRLQMNANVVSICWICGKTIVCWHVRHIDFIRWLYVNVGFTVCCAALIADLKTSWKISSNTWFTIHYFIGTTVIINESHAVQPLSCISSFVLTSRLHCLSLSRMNRYSACVKPIPHPQHHSADVGRPVCRGWTHLQQQKQHPAQCWHPVCGCR